MIKTIFVISIITNILYAAITLRTKVFITPETRENTSMYDALQGKFITTEGIH